MKKTILGVKIDDVSMDEAVEIVESWLSGSVKHYIVTPNPEFLVTAQKDTQFKKILNSADLAIPDGVGLKLAGVKNTVAGTDLMEKLCKLASEKGYTIGLLGGERGVAGLCANSLQKKYPNLNITFVDEGGKMNEDGKFSLRSNNKDPITDLLFVAFGHPKQEYWIAENLDKIPIKVAMGVGGAFDYISGKVPRAPIWFRNAGLEWLFRLTMQPWRIKRQLKLIKFLYYLVFKNIS